MGLAVTQILAEFVNNLSFKDIPEKAVETAKTAMMDCLGCMFVGAVQPIGKIIKEYVNDVGAKSSSALVGMGFRTSPALAALANGVTAHAEDFDDISLPMLGHPSAPIFPAVLSLSEYCGSTGEEIIEAYVAGYEVGAKLGMNLNVSHYNKGWHGTATVGTPAAAAASAKLLKLSSDQTRMALAIAVSQTSGLRQNFGTMTKPFHAGNAARSGVLAALLAKKGFTADMNIIEAPMGYCNIFKGEIEMPIEYIVENLGKVFVIEQAGIAFKIYPSCGETHAGIEVVMDLVKEHKFKVEDIASVECVFNDTMESVMLHHDPKTGLEGKFSIEYCVARTLLDGTVKLADFTNERVNQPEIRELIGKIKATVDSSHAMMATTINIELKDGRKLSGNLFRSRGWPDNPFTKEELQSKYKECAGLVLADSDVTKSLEIMDNLEKLRNAKDLADIVVKDK